MPWKKGNAKTFGDGWTLSPKWRAFLGNVQKTFRKPKGFPGGSGGKGYMPAVLEMWVRSLGWEDPQQYGEIPVQTRLGSWTHPRACVPLPLPPKASLHSLPPDSSLPRPQNPTEMPKEAPLAGKRIDLGTPAPRDLESRLLFKTQGQQVGQPSFGWARMSGRSQTAQVKRGLNSRQSAWLFSPTPGQSRDPRLPSLQGWESSPSQGGGRKLTMLWLSLFSFNLMVMLCGNIVDLPFGACGHYTAAWFSKTYINICHICSFLDCFALEVIAEFQT